MTGYEPLETLKPVAPDLWVVDGPIIRFFGMPYPTRMTVIRLANGQIVLHSPIGCTDGLARDVAALGVVRHLVSPNWIHYAGIPSWQSAFPEALSWASPGVQTRAAKQGVRVRFDRELGEGQEAPWAAEMDQLIVRGSRVHEEVVFFHRASATLILADLIENFEARFQPSWFRLLAGFAGVLDPDGRAPLDMRFTFRDGKDRARAAVDQMIAWGPERVILAHGRWYERDGVAELQRAFRWV